MPDLFSVCGAVRVHVPALHCVRPVHGDVGHVDERGGTWTTVPLPEFAADPVVEFWPGAPLPRRQPGRTLAE